MDAHTLLKPYSDSNEFAPFSKCMIRVPGNQSQPMTVAAFPESCELRSAEIERFMNSGELDGKRRKSLFGIGGGVQRFNEAFFTAHGWRFKILSSKAGGKNERLQHLYRSNDMTLSPST